MPNLQQNTVTDWLVAIHPARSQSEWPPSVRPIETQDEAPELLGELGNLLSRFGDGQLEELSRALRTQVLASPLRETLVQLGAARLFRLLHWLGEREVPDSHLVVAALVEGNSDEARALRGAITAFMRRILLTRLFAPDRLAALQAATETALKEAA